MQEGTKAWPRRNKTLVENGSVPLEILADSLIPAKLGAFGPATNGDLVEENDRTKMLLKTKWLKVGFVLVCLSV